MTTLFISIYMTFDELLRDNISEIKLCVSSITSQHWKSKYSHDSSSAEWHLGAFSNFDTVSEVCWQHGHSFTRKHKYRYLLVILLPLMKSGLFYVSTFWTNNLPRQKKSHNLASIYLVFYVYCPSNYVYTSSNWSLSSGCRVCHY